MLIHPKTITQLQPLHTKISKLHFTISWRNYLYSVPAYKKTWEPGFQEGISFSQNKYVYNKKEGENNTNLPLLSQFSLFSYSKKICTKLKYHKPVNLARPAHVPRLVHQRNTSPVFLVKITFVSLKWNNTAHNSFFKRLVVTCIFPINKTWIWGYPKNRSYTFMMCGCRQPSCAWMHVRQPTNIIIWAGGNIEDAWCWLNNKYCNMGYYIPLFELPLILVLLDVGKGSPTHHHRQ